MSSKLTVLIFTAIITITYGEQPTNYDVSRNRINAARNGFTIRDIWDYLIGAGYGQYPYGQHPGQYPGQYPGSGHYPGSGQYPGSGLYPGGSGLYPGGQYGGYRPGLEGPPGAHPGCPLCDSSVYSYCSRKQAHDSCCCENSNNYLGYGCRKTNCNFLHANSCEEYHLISNCCCVDLQKNAAAPPVVPVAVVA